MPSEGCCYREMREEREESSERARRVGKRSRLPVSIDPPRRSRAHLVFHPTSSSAAFSLCHERERLREGETREKERARDRNGWKEARGGGREGEDERERREEKREISGKRTVIYRLADNIPENAQNETRLASAAYRNSRQDF